MSLINTPLGYVLRWLSSILGGNFAAAVFAFTLLINLIMLPLTYKSQKTSADQARLKPRLDAIKKRCGDDKNKYTQEQQALYQKEGISMSGGCLPMLIRLVIMWGVYEVITSPLTYILNFNATAMSDASLIAGDLGLITGNVRGSELTLFSLLEQGKIEIAGVTGASLNSVSFNLFGLQLTETPVFSWNIFSGFKPIWLIPIISFVTSILSGVASSLVQKKNNPEAPNMMAMMLMMPVISLIIAFSVPGAVGFYWAASNIISGGLNIAMQLIYSPNRMVAIDQAKAIIKKNKAEKALIAKNGTV